MLVFKKMINSIAHLLPQIHQHPFNKGLRKGTLPKPVFYAFLEQDKFYLYEFSNVLKKIANRSPSDHHQQLFYKLSKNAFNTQDKLHHKYLLPTGSPRFFIQNAVKPIKLLPAVSNYIHYLHQTADHGPIQLAVASCIPCFYLYSDLGLTMKNKGVGKSNPYHLWIASYSSEEFILSKDSIIKVADELAIQLGDSEQDDMVSAFVKATHFEISFWDSAYKLDNQVFCSQLVANCGNHL
jgi:thiaminase/transcriptional activator TenA